MGKGYKRKTRWRTLSIGAPPGEEDEEDGIRNGYVKGQENGTSTRNGQAGHKTGRTDSAGSTTSDYASDYASAVSRTRRNDSSGSPSQPKIIFNENEYTRITTPRQDVLFKKGYLSRKKVWASTASTSATPSTTESQSASHSTADGSETTEDQQLLDCKENGAEEYPTMMEPGAQVAYGTFYDHTSGYYYEYPVMVVGPGPCMPGGPPMHNVLTAMPCGPVPLRPIEWVNPAFVPKIGDEQYCVVDYQTAQLCQYPTLVDENGVPLAAQTENTNGSDESVYHENGNGSASWADTVADKEQTVNEITNTAVTQNGTTETTSTNEIDDVVVQASINSENYLENALAQQLHVTHVAAVPPIPEPYVYPGHYMFGPSLINVNGVTIQSGPMVRNTGITGGPTNTGACAKRRKKKKLSRRKSKRPLGPGNAEDEEPEEEEYSSEAENIALLGQPGIANEAETAGTATIDDSSSSGTSVTASKARPLNPECREFRPILAARTVVESNDEAGSSICETTTINDQAISGPTSSGETTNNEQTNDDDDDDDDEGLKIQEVSPIDVHRVYLGDFKDEAETKNLITTAETSVKLETKLDNTEKLVSRKSEEFVGAPVDFAAEVFANVTTMAERALAPRSVVEGTPVETEIGLDATFVNFQEIVENHRIFNDQEIKRETEQSIGNGTRLDRLIDEINVPNGHENRCASSGEINLIRDQQSSEISAEGTSGYFVAEKLQRDTMINEKRGSRSASPGIINRTTTPINANSHRLPDSYESLVTRVGSVTAAPIPIISCSLPMSNVTTSVQPQQARNRKYSSKQSGTRFVREATPGPDLEEIEAHTMSCAKLTETRVRKDEPESSTARISSVDSIEVKRNDEDEAVATGIEAIESEIQRYSLSTTELSGSYAWDKSIAGKNNNNGRNSNAEVSNDDSGIETQARFHTSEHPITDAVTEWLQRANSPELFVTTGIISESEPEDDELENDEPPKNLHGNPMPALSANSTDVKNSHEFSRFANHGKFNNFIQATILSTKERDIGRKNNANIDVESKTINDETSLITRKNRRGDYNDEITEFNASFVEESIMASKERKSVVFCAKNNAEAARQRLLDSSSSSNSSSEVVKKIMVNEVCELTENDSVAGMRVAKSSRMINNVSSITSTKIIETCKSHNGLAEKRRRTRRNDKIKRISLVPSRQVPIENVEIKVRRITGDEKDEGIVVEDENDGDDDDDDDETREISVKTFEKGQIVVSNEGKVLPVDNYKPILLKNFKTREDKDRDDNYARPIFTKITHQRNETNDDDVTSVSDDASKRNSLGSIEEPDVMECWEVETVEPLTMPKRITARGTSSEETEITTRTATLDPAGMEIVRKYYRLEAMRDSGTSVTTIDDDYRENYGKIDTTRVSIVDSTDYNTNEQNTSIDVIPVIGERMNKIVGMMIERSVIPIEEAVEAYESCYVAKKSPYLVDFDVTKYQSRNLYGQDAERDGAVPCKAACCNIQ